MVGIILLDKLFLSTRQKATTRPRQQRPPRRDRREGRQNNNNNNKTPLPDQARRHALLKPHMAIFAVPKQDQPTGRETAGSVDFRFPSLFGAALQPEFFWFVNAYYQNRTSKNYQNRTVIQQIYGNFFGEAAIFR